MLLQQVVDEFRRTGCTRCQTKKDGIVQDFLHMSCFTCVTEVEVLVGKFFPIDAHPARAVSLNKVPPLKHEVLDHAVERRALVPRRYALPQNETNQANQMPTQTEKPSFLSKTIAITSSSSSSGTKQKLNQRE